MIHRLILAFSTGFVACASLTTLLAAEKKLPEARLQQLFKAYPDADANKDGKLSVDEARQYATKLRGQLLHHPRHGQVIERRCKELGIPVTAVYGEDQKRSAKTEGAVVEFLLRHVGLPVAGGNGSASIHKLGATP